MDSFIPCPSMSVSTVVRGYRDLPTHRLGGEVSEKGFPGSEAASPGTASGAWWCVQTAATRRTPARRQLATRQVCRPQKWDFPPPRRNMGSPTGSTIWRGAGGGVGFPVKLKKGYLQQEKQIHAQTSGKSKSSVSPGFWTGWFLFKVKHQDRIGHWVSGYSAASIRAVGLGMVAYQQAFTGFHDI